MEKGKYNILNFKLYYIIQGIIMSLTINIYYTGENGSARKFAEEMVEKGVVARVRSEKCNQKYEYFFPMDDPETVLLIDRWESQEALDEHHKSPMMKEIAELRDKYHLHMKVEQFVERKQESKNLNCNTKQQVVEVIEIEKKNIGCSVNCHINSNFIVYNPYKKEEKEVWYSKDLKSFGYSENFYYNIYGIKIWTYLSEYEHIKE